jgi:phosphatidate cytidylyltransferase
MTLKTRIVSGLIGFSLLVVILLADEVFLSVFLTIICVIGLCEFFNAVSKIGINSPRKLAYLSAVSMLLLSNRIEGLIKDIFVFVPQDKFIVISFCFTFVFFICLASLMVFRNDKYSIKDISAAIFGIMYIVALLSFVLLTRQMQNGRYFVWLIFIGAFATDTFAYFTGVFIGRTKIIEKISPKKTLEGCIGGVVGCIFVIVAYGYYMNNNLYTEIDIIKMVLLGIICGVISQIGDWTASAIKRYVDIKDYGNIMPGHGGVIDRLDSIFFVAPVVYFYIKLVLI